MQPAPLAARSIGACSKQHWQHAQFTNICMRLSSTLHAAERGGMPLGA